MKFIADENLGSQIPKYLQSIGFDIVSTSDLIDFGAKDPDILHLANIENRVLITFDKDFGELVFKEKLLHNGVILIRLKDESIGNKMKVLKKILKSKKNFGGKFTRIKG